MRETRHTHAKRLQALLYHMRKNDKLQIALQLQKQLSELSFSTIHPEVAAPMIAHCGAWHCFVVLDDNVVARCKVCESVIFCAPRARTFNN